MSVDTADTIIGVGAAAVLLVHVMAFVGVLRTAWPWWKKLRWAFLVCSVALLGPLYFFMYRSTWDHTSSDVPSVNDQNAD